MKSWKIWAFVIAILFCISVGIYLLSPKPMPEGAIARADIVSYCVGDATGSGGAELLAISGKGTLEIGKDYGEVLLVCDASAQGDLDKLGYIPAEKIIHTIDLADIKPMKIQLGDINGDGVNELAICVYKTAKFHPVMAMRPFFFDLVEGNLIPIWLGSRLSRPFDDYILCDIDSDDIQEIVSIERLEDDRCVVAVYDWRGFGFEILTQSEALDGTLNFEPSLNNEPEVKVTLDRGADRQTLIFHLSNGELIYK